MELSHHGGHVGFVTGALPWRPDYWLESRILGFLREISADDRIGPS
jgi:predicted alpha/beta-fold hydrolase